MNKKLINQKITEFDRRERLKSALIIVFISLLISLAVIVIVMPPMGERSYDYGTVLTLSANQGMYGNKLLLVILLDSGKRVSVAIPNSSYYKKGLRVEVQRRDPLFFGGSSFRFSKYLY